jgi:hypothetical protein
MVNGSGDWAKFTYLYDLAFLGLFVNYIFVLQVGSGAIKNGSPR